MHNNNHPHVHHNNYNTTTSAVQAVMNTSMYAIVTPKEIESIQQECDSCLQVFSRLRLSRVVNRLLSLLEKLNQREVRLMEILDAYNHTLNEPIFSQFYQQTQALIVDSLANTVTNHEHAKMLTEEEREAIANLKACILLRRGAVYHALEDYDNELRDVSAVMELEKIFPALRKFFMMSAWERTALVASELYQHDKAVEAWNFYLALESEYHDAYYNRALSWSALGEQKRAIQDNIRCIELNPHNVEAYINCAACYLDIGEHSLALEFLELALEQNSRHPMAYMCEFRVHFKLRDYKRALKSLRRVEKLISDPEDKYHDRMKDVWEEYGHVYHRLAKKRLCLCSKCAKTEEDKQKRKELFRKYCDKSINAFIKSRHYARMRKVTMTKTDHLIEMLRERAKIFHAEESMNEALADCALIIKVSEDSTLDIHEVYNMVGQLYIQKGMPDASLLAFSNALRQHESCEFALKGKAIALHKLGKLEEAFDSFKVFDATYPDNSDVQYWIQVLERNIENRCALCGKEARENNPLKRCGRCKMVYYCSAECQRSDWTSCHKSNCDASMRLELHSTGKESPVGQHDTISSHHLSTGDNENE